jgi:Rv2525c-like, glycoside hydrolase-like domain
MSPIAQGLDRAAAPDAATAKRMLDAIDGRWWCVYIGGPTSRASGWTPQLVGEYVKRGIDRFMLTYAGRQWGGPLTHDQGQIDAREALQLAARFGYSGNYPLCLDVEQHTYDTHPAGTVEYVRAWCAAVRAANVRPGVYANPAPLRAMHGQVDAEYVWVASWISHGVVRHDPRAAPGVHADHWPAQGQRAWQYAGAYGNGACRVLGLDVDINVADLECLANPPGIHHGHTPIHGTAASSGVVRGGDRGDAVVRVTRRLSFVPSHVTGKPYLDSKRKRFDAEAVKALKAFQAEHHLAPDGVYGEDSARALARAVRVEKQRRARVRAGGGGGGTPTPPTPTPTPVVTNGARGGAAKLVALVKDVQRLDAETDHAWQALAAYGERRRHALSQARERAVDLADLARILTRIEHDLETLIDYEEHGAPAPAPSAAQPQSAPASAPAPVPAAANGGDASAAADPKATATATAAPPAEAQRAQGPSSAAPYYRPPPVAPGHGDSGAPPPPGPPPAPRTPRKPEDLSDEELLHRIDRLDRAIGRSRDVLIARYALAEKQIGKLTHHAKPAPAPHGGHTPAPPKPPPAPAPVKHPAVPVKIGVRNLQRTLNEFTAAHLKGMAPLVVDGKKGSETQKRIKLVKYYLGYGKKQGRSTRVDAELVRRIHRPGSPRLSNPAMLTRARARRRKQHKNAERVAAPRAGVATFDGKAVAAWMKPYLDWAREQGWQGTLSSGWRDPAYSESLCMGICHAAKCPGRCAGRSSNHVGRVKPSGAIDVTHYEEFGRLMQHCPYSPRIFNDLPADRVHFSATGH